MADKEISNEKVEKACTRRMNLEVKDLLDVYPNFFC